VVNSLADDGDGTCTDTKCTLRDAIAFASPGATITFSVTGTIMLATGHGALVVEKNLTISGPGASQLAVNAEFTGSPVFFIADAHVSISGLTIELGFNANGGSGIFNEAVLTLANVSIDGNMSNFGAGGGILNTGTLTIIASTLSRNGSPLGSAIYNSGDATITNSTISGSGNAGEEPDAAIKNTGALILINSTVSNNQVPAIDNRAGFMALFSTIVANNPGNCFAPITTDGGYNIEDGTTCGFTAATSHSSSNPGLDPTGLQNNGGPTKTIALLLNSFAVDLIPVGVNGCGTTITTDQRGVARPFNGACDVGAHELDFRGFLPPINNVRTNPIHPGKGVPIQFSLGGDHGLAIFAAGSPSSEQIDCRTSDVSGDAMPTVTAGKSQLSYDPSTDIYTYVWKTDKAWAGTCRRLVVTFADGSVRTADFSFER
jgi:CSLREA domain-containing protein